MCTLINYLYLHIFTYVLLYILILIVLLKYLSIRRKNYKPKVHKVLNVVKSMKGLCIVSFLTGSAACA